MLRNFLPSVLRVWVPLDLFSPCPSHSLSEPHEEQGQQAQQLWQRLWLLADLAVAQQGQHQLWQRRVRGEPEADQDGAWSDRGLDCLGWRRVPDARSPWDAPVDGRPLAPGPELPDEPLSAELPEADILGAEAVKAMITGDLMTGREIRRSPFSFTPKAAHLFSANTLPSVRDMTRGFWRRWLLLDFTREFTEDEQDQRLASRIIASEMAAVASWALQGAANLAARGQYDVPQSSHDTLDEWKMVADQVAAFMEDRCALTDHNDRSEYTPLSRVYNHYRTWAESNGHSPLSIRKFGRRLSGLGVMRKRQSSGMTYALSVGPILKAVN